MKRSTGLIAVSLAVSLLVPVSAQAVSVQMKAGHLTLPGTSNGQTTFTQITFASAFSTKPIVVAGPIGILGSAPSASRIRNVTTTGFEIAQVEPPGEDGQHAAEPITWMAIEPIVTGNYVSLGGAMITTGTIDTQTTIAKAGGSHETISFGVPYGSAPVVLGNIQTMNNAELAIAPPPGGPSVPWLTTSIKDVNATGAKIAMERAETTTGTITTDETLGFITIGIGSGNFVDDGGATVLFDSQATADNIDGYDDGKGNWAPFNQAFSSAPNVLAAMRKRDGLDGGWVRYDSGNISATQVKLMIDEDRSGDNERGHTPEAISMFAYSATAPTGGPATEFSVTLKVIPEPLTMIAVGMSVAGLGGYIRRRRRC